MDEADFTVGGAEVLVRCRLPASAVRLSHRPGSRLPLTLEQRKAAREHCGRLRAQGVRADPLPLYRVERWHLEEDCLVIGTGSTDYGEYLACDTAFPRWGLTAAPLSISAVSVCEGSLLLEERSRRVAVLPGFLNVVPSGHVHPPQTPLEAMLAEAREELGLRPEEIRSSRCLGLMRSGGCFEVVYSLEAQATLTDLVARVPEGAWEKGRIVSVTASAESLRDTLLTARAELTDVAVACLLMEGRERFGSDWFRETLAATSELPSSSS